MSERGYELKGSVFTMMVLHLEDAIPEQIQQLLEQKVSQAPKFFDSAPLVINVELLTEIPNFSQIISAILAANFIPVGITGAKSGEMREAAKKAGLAILTAGKEANTNTDAVTLHTPKETIYKTPSELREEQETVPIAPSETENLASTKVVQSNVRSGQQIYSPGPVVILGSVSNGAEIISNDSIHVYGTLRGRALAGARGNHDARIFCGHLDAELISIAGHYLLSDSLPEQHIGQEVQIRLENEKIIFDKLTS
jgi:septum site-determining protein MinC